MLLNNFACGSGGIGRRARFRFLWVYARGGSSPFCRTKHQKKYRFLQKKPVLFLWIITTLNKQINKKYLGGKMLHLILAGVSATITLCLGKEKFSKYWKGGVIGVLIMFLADSLSIKLNYYVYPEGMLYIGSLPVFHIVNIFLISSLSKIL